MTTNERASRDAAMTTADVVALVAGTVAIPLGAVWWERERERETRKAEHLDRARETAGLCSDEPDPHPSHDGADMTQRAAADFLGRTFRDRVTGFTGVAVCHATYLTGCDQVGLQPKVNEKGDIPDSRWFDVTRIDEEDVAPIEIDRGPGVKAGADESILRAPGMRRP
jgi:hypothetical protein